MVAQKVISPLCIETSKHEYCELIDTQLKQYLQIQYLKSIFTLKISFSKINKNYTIHFIDLPF